MDETSYVLQMDHVTWELNALKEFVAESSEKWEGLNQVMPFIKLTNVEPPVLDIIKQLTSDFHISLNESYIVKLKANSVLEKHSDHPRIASFNFPLTDNATSAFVKFYIQDSTPPDPYHEAEYTHNITSTPFIYNVRLNHSFHNPTDSDVILLNLSTFNDWDQVKSIIESKRM